MNSIKATKWLTELNISDKNPFEYNSVTKNFWCKPCKKAISADSIDQNKVPYRKENRKQHCSKSDTDNAHVSMKTLFMSFQEFFKSGIFY